MSEAPIEVLVKLTPVKARLMAALVRCLDVYPDMTLLDIIDSAMFRHTQQSCSSTA